MCVSCAAVQQFVPELAREALRLAAGELERRVFGAVAVAAPGQVVAAQGAGVVLQLDQVQAAAAEDEQVDLVPLALAVAELEVRPRAERGLIRQQVMDDVQAFRLMGELGRRYLDPALDLLRHDPSPSSPPWATPCPVPRGHILPLRTDNRSQQTQLRLFESPAANIPVAILGLEGGSAHVFETVKLMTEAVEGNE